MRTKVSSLLSTLLAAAAAASPAAAQDAGPGAAHWAFQTPRRPELPAAELLAPGRGEIDGFIAAALAKAGLAASEEAPRQSLIRRLAFDLTGLPPSPEDAEAFAADPAPDAYERLVDRLLASPQYGERWGRHWLDAAGYADSNGYFHADSDRPLAWRYRDWVIRAVNEDKPFDVFLSEQIAGDEFAGYSPDGDVTPEIADRLVATHYLRNAPDGTGESDGNPDEVRADRLRVLEGVVQILGSGVLGLTLQCARCHEHKFDPVSQEEYYRLQAVFFNAFNPERWKKPGEREVEAGTRTERDTHRRQVEEIDARIAALKKSLEDAAAAPRRRIVVERLAAIESVERARVLAAIDKTEKERSAEEKELLKHHQKTLEIPLDAIAERSAEFRERKASIESAIAGAEKERPAPLERLAILTEDDAEPAPHHVLVRGDYKQLGVEVAPGVPAILETPANRYALAPRPSGRVSSGRRSALARWLTSPENPLVARVLVNRVWQHHFGAGIVSSSENFGRRGSSPSHPELLDWLATELARRSWSLKALHRQIVGSATYRRSSAPRADGLRLDAENRLLWRFPLRRLDAESVRDALLAAAGDLDLAAGGPFVPTRRADDGKVVVDEGAPGARRRSVYLQQRRTQLLSLLEVFDAPRIDTNCTRRGASTIPLQSLALLNSEFALARARGLADRLERDRLDRDKGAAPGDAIDRAFRIAAGRAPVEEEREAAVRFLAEQAEHYAGDAAPGRRALEDFCQMLVASNAFLYVE